MSELIRVAIGPIEVSRLAVKFHRLSAPGIDTQIGTVCAFSRLFINGDQCACIIDSVDSAALVDGHGNDVLSHVWTDGLLFSSLQIYRTESGAVFVFIRNRNHIHDTGGKIIAHLNGGAHPLIVHVVSYLLHVTSFHINGVKPFGISGI